MNRNIILDRIELPGSAYQLAILRILMGLQILHGASSLLFEVLLDVEGTQGTVTIFPDFMDQFLETYSVPLLVILVRVFSVFFTLGLFTRITTPILTISFILLYGFVYKKFDAPVQWLYFWFPLIVLCFSRCSDQLSIDKWLNRKNKSFPLQKNSYRWPIELCTGWFGYIYTAAGIAKIFPLHNFLAWAEGGTSQGIFYYRFLDSPLYFIFGRPLFDYSSDSISWIFGVMSIMSVILELSCVLLFFTRKYNLIILVSILAMHFCLFLVGVSGFMATALVLGFTLLDPRWFKDYGVYPVKISE